MLLNTSRNLWRKNKHQADNWDPDRQEDFFTHQEFGRKHLLQDHLAMLQWHYGTLYQDVYGMKVPLKYFKNISKHIYLKMHSTCNACEKVSHYILFTVLYQISSYYYYIYSFSSMTTYLFPVWQTYFFFFIYANNFWNCANICIYTKH